MAGKHQVGEVEKWCGLQKLCRRRLRNLTWCVLRQLTMQYALRRFIWTPPSATNTIRPRPAAWTLVEHTQIPPQQVNVTVEFQNVSATPPWSVTNVCFMPPLP